MTNFQRKGSLSNTDVGDKFEEQIYHQMRNNGYKLERKYNLEVGISSCKKKSHEFDLGSNDPKIIVECKTHTFTESGYIPSAKLKNWAEAMYYFHMAPKDYKKIFIAMRATRNGNNESLLEYFFRTQRHLIPDDVQLWEFNDNKLIGLK